MIKTMTIYLFLLTLFSIPLAADAQDGKKEIQTLFGNESSFGGYLGLNMKFGEIEGQEALFTGGELAFVIDRSFNIGFEGYGMVNRVNTVQSADISSRRFLQMGYGGVHLEPVIASESVFHLSIPVLIGAGGIGETNRPYWEEVDGEIIVDLDQEYEQSDFFFVAEPGVDLEVNIFKFMRLAGGASYRFTSQVDMGSIQDRDLHGWQGNLSLRIGWF